jgi:demethylmenaquinone methyltransferase/2-methoxy-6-polyprenyl-1,4-benzoquinol methylase
MGGEQKVRGEIASWLAACAGDEVLSLCCGTGATDRALLALVPTVRITGIDLGRGQLSRARRKDATGQIVYRLADAAETGLESESFDTVMLVGALHEMPRSLRSSVLREARRLVKPSGSLLVFEPCRTRTRGSALSRSLVLFLWIPGNPETRTMLDLIAHGLDTELREAGFEPLERHTTTPDWFEGILARAV